MNINKKQAAIYAGVLFLGVAMGGSVNKTKTITVEKPVEVIKRVEVVKTPQACLDLKRMDNELNAHHATYFANLSAGTAGSASNFISVMSTETGVLTAKIKELTPSRQAAAEGCK